jgi:dTMP kinase
VQTREHERGIDHHRDSIQRDIAAGTTVVIDRYYYSGCVYSAAKHNPTLDLKWARHPDEGLPRPDLCLFLELSAEAAAKRGGFGGEKYENQQMQSRVRELFHALMESADREDFVRIDAGASLEKVQESVRLAVLKTMAAVDEHGLPLRFVQPW